MAGDSRGSNEGCWWVAVVVLSIVIFLVVSDRVQSREDNGPVRNRIVEIEYE